MKAEELIAWAQAVDRKVEAAKIEEEREEWEFRHVLHMEIANNEVDQAIKRLLIPWYLFGRPFPKIPIIDLDGKKVIESSWTAPTKDELGR